MRAPFPAILAAAAVDAAGGVLAAAVANGLGPRPNIEAFFTGCALAAALGHALLTPGCVWTAGPLAPRRLVGALLMRTVVAGIALSCAPVVVITVMEIPLHVAGRNFNLDLSALALTASGLVAGLGSIAGATHVGRLCQLVGWCSSSLRNGRCPFRNELLQLQAGWQNLHLMRLPWGP